MTPTYWMWLIFVTFVGACVGSFLNVVVYRLPRGESIVSPPSACPRCGHRLAAYDNVPVLGWLWLRGKCRYCREPISPEYPIIEAITAALFGGWFFICYGTDLQPGFSGPGLAETALILLGTLTLIGGLIAATLIDARLYIIPLQIPWLVTLVALLLLPLAVWLFPFAVVEVPIPTDRPGLLSPASERLAGVAEPYRHAAAVRTAIDFREAGPVPVTAAPLVSARATWAASAGLLGLIIANLLVWRGVLPRSFADEEEYLKQSEDFDPNDPQSFLSYPHARREMLKEALFLSLPIAGFAIGWYLAGADAELGYVGRVFGGVITGYLAGGLTVWATRVIGTLGFGREAMGLGDVHLMAAVGAVAGWQVAVVAFFVAPFFGLAWAALAAGAQKLLDREVKAIPYGPHLAVATVVVMVAREPVLAWFGAVLY